jgi:hypothetical protein
MHKPTEWQYKHGNTVLPFDLALSLACGPRRQRYKAMQCAHASQFIGTLQFHFSAAEHAVPFISLYKKIDCIKLRKISVLLITDIPGRIFLLTTIVATFLIGVCFASRA